MNKMSLLNNPKIETCCMGFGDGSFFDLEWLSPCRYDSLQSSSSKITKELDIGAIRNPDCVPIPTLDYQEVMQTEEGLLRAMQSICEQGTVLI
jgi:hypothetical protein